MTYNNLFVAKLPRSVTDVELEKIFADYNPVSAKVMLDASSGKSKGFGFVLFSTEEEGRRAYNALDRTNTTVCRHTFTLMIYPSQHNGRAAVSPSTALYIRNIPITVPEKQVEEFLATFGTLTYCAMRGDHYGNPVWVVYVEYDCLDCSRNALQKLHGSSEHFGGPPVMVKYADSDEAKRERRRRREEGKIAAAPPPRAAPLFPPPPRPAAAAGAGASSSGGANTAACSQRTTPSHDSTISSLGTNQISELSSTTSSVHKVLRASFSSLPLRQANSGATTTPVYLSPPPKQMPPMCPIVCQKPLMVHQTGAHVDPLPAMVMLENGQQLLVASNAVNLRTSNAAFSQSGLLWLPVDGVCAPAPSHRLAVGLFP